MKRLLSFAMAFVFMLTAVPVSAIAATHEHSNKTETTSDGTLEYTYCAEPRDKTVSFSLQAYPESSHSYGNNINESYSYSVPNADSLELKFSEKCFTEKDYDIITITDANGEKVGSYSGAELAGKTVSVPTGSFNVNFVTDRSRTYYGFSIDSVTAKVGDFSYYVPNVKQNGTKHDYDNYTDETINYSCPGAKSITLEFSHLCFTENNVDIITITDENGKVVGKYSGYQLASKKVTISGSAFSIRFTSDRSKTFYGYSIESMTAVMAGTTEVMPNHEYTITLPKEKYPESEHNYANNLKTNYTFRYANAKSLKVTFSSKCKTEDNCDIVSIYDEDGTKIGSYSGTELASLTVEIPKNSFRIEFVTDWSKNFYGFSIDSIVATMNANPDVPEEKSSDSLRNDFLPRTSHDYSNYSDETFTFTDVNASSLDLQFDSACKTEKNVDIVSVYDENDALVGEYSGEDLSSHKLHINGSSVKIRFVSDRSKTFYGYSLKYLNTNYTSPHEGSNLYSYPESSHRYTNSALETYEYYCQKPLTKCLELQFSQQTYTEADSDIISIYGSNGKLVGTYSGSQLAGKTIRVDGSYFKIVFKSDWAVAYYGFSLDAITAVQSTDSYSQKEISHNYKLTNAVKPTSSQEEKMYYTCTNCGDFKQISDQPFQSYAYNMSADTFDYDGNTHRPIVSISDGTRVLQEDVDYTLTYPASSKAIGNYRITVNFKNGYLGTKYLYYSIKAYSKKDSHNHSDKTVTTSDGTLEYTYCAEPRDKTVSFSLQAYPESSHSYGNNINESYSYSVPNADSLELKFSEKCFTEKDYDIITITDANGEKVGSYSGAELAGKTVSVPTGSFNVNFVTDRSRTYYGFSIDSVTAKVGDFSYYVPNVKQNGTKHDYDNYTDETINYSCPGAKSITLEFSHLCFTENNVDIITITDENGKVVGKYSGYQLASKKVTISGSAFSIRFTSDRSKTFYGYSIESMTAVMAGTTEVMPNHEYTITLPKEKYPESEHNYANNLKTNYTFRYANAKSLKVTFSSKCKTEDNCDIVSIYDEDGTKIGSYSGTELASLTVEIPKNSFRIEFVTDWSKNFYGFSIDSIVATMNANPDVPEEKSSDSLRNDFLPRTSHDYSNYSDETFTFTDVNASSLDLQFDSACKTEKNVDIVSVYDENDALVGEYSGEDLSSHKLHINGSSVKIRFVSDRSKTFYGYSLKYLNTNYTSPHEGSNLYSYPESSHRYTNSALETYEYYCQKPLTKCLELQFSQQTYTEADSDIISIYGSNGKLVGTYSGSQLAGKTIRVDGSYFKIVFKSDWAVAYYGFSLDAITAVQSTDSYSQKEISHNYKLTNAVKPTSSQEEKMYYTCTNCGDFKQISDQPFQSYIYTLSADSFDYDGKNHRPAVTINDKSRELTEGTDYDLTYPSKSADSGTYRITVNFKNGYSGTKYLYYSIKSYNKTQTQSYKQYLLEQGFPESYTAKLVALHEKYPNWEFKVYNTGLDWQTAVNGERSPHSKQRIGVYESKSLPADYLCSCSKCKGVVQDSSYAASEKAVKYYMDPRNWLDEKHIFQFETTNGGSGQTREGVESILKGTWMYNSRVRYTNTYGTQMLYDSTLKYSDIIMQAAAKSGLAPYYIASKIKQEVGSSSSSYAGGSRGTVMPFQGIYNYFNIGAYNGANDGLAWAAGFLKVKDGQRADLYQKGDNGKYVLDVSLYSDQRMVYIDMDDNYFFVRLYAENGADKYLTGRTGYIKKSDVRTTYVGPDFGGNDKYYRPWITPYRAIIYGSKYIYNSYGIYQYTGYLQKFNVSSNQRYSHEYMVNVSSAQAEGAKIYSGYASNGLLNSKHTFYIPVFKNM